MSTRKKEDFLGRPKTKVLGYLLFIFLPFPSSRSPFPFFYSYITRKRQRSKRSRYQIARAARTMCHRLGTMHKRNSFSFLKVISFFFFLLFWVFVAAQTFLQLWRAAVTLQLWCTSFSLWWLLLLQSMGSRAHSLQQFCLPGSTAQAQQLWCRGQLLRGTQDLLRSGIEPLSSALAGKFCTTELPGKPQKFIF